MVISRVSFILSFLLLSFYSFSQNTFQFSELVYMIDGKKIGSNEVQNYENLNVLVDGISGCAIEDGYAELGMEVVITDDNSNRLLYSPDMLLDSRLNKEDLKNVQFNIDLNEDFNEGKEYFIKIKIWDKRTNKGFSKHSMFKVVAPLRNENVYVDVRRLRVSGYKIYLNGDRVFKSNVIRHGDQLVMDLFFEELVFEKNEDILVVTEIIDEQNSNSITLKNEYVIAEKTEDLKSVLIKTDINSEKLVHGKDYIYHLQFHNASRNQKLDLKYNFTFFDSDWKSNTIKMGGVDFMTFLNKEKIKSNPVVKIGDRLDFEFHNVSLKLAKDFGFGKIGGVLMIYDPSGEKIFTSKDLYRDYGFFPLENNPIFRFNYTIPYNFRENSKYVFEFVIWDKYGKSYLIKKFPMKIAKTKDYSFGLRENINLNCKYIESKVTPITVHVIRNNYKEFSNLVNPLDELSLLIACNLKEGYKPSQVTRFIHLYDAEDNLLTQDEEDIQDFNGGEVTSSIVIPEFGIKLNKEYKLVTTLKDGNEELVKVEYTFIIVK